jgi:hypothetical protein
VDYFGLHINGLRFLRAGTNQVTQTAQDSPALRLDVAGLDNHWLGLAFHNGGRFLHVNVLGSHRGVPALLVGVGDSRARWAAAATIGGASRGSDAYVMGAAEILRVVAASEREQQFAAKERQRYFP